MTEAIPSDTPLRRPLADDFPGSGARWWVLAPGPNQGKAFCYRDDGPANEPAGTLRLVLGNPKQPCTGRRGTTAPTGRLTAMHGLF